MISQDIPNKLFLLDAYALIFRAYYAFIRNPRVNSKGQNTSAIFGFVNAMLDVLNNEKPDHIAVVFDPHGPTFRVEIDPQYKANRDETPEDIKMSTPYIMEIVKAFGIPVIQVDNYEADDVIGTLAKRAEKEGLFTYMMTPDKDYAQLVTEKSVMFRPGRQGNPAEVWDIAAVQERFGVEHPTQVIDILGLQGDSADNIPGIPGIGPKTAAKLIQKYGSVEGLLEHTHELKGKQKENVENFAEQGRMSKVLATIITDVPVDLEWSDLKVTPLHKERLRELFAELEFRTLAKRVLGEELTTVSEGDQMDMFATNTPAPAKAATPEAAAEPEPEAPALQSVETTDHDYKLIEGDAIAGLVKELQGASVYCFDTETTSLNPLEANLVGLAFSVEKGKAYYVPVPQDREVAQGIVDQFRPVFEDPAKEVVAHNFKYDYKVMRRYNVDIQNKVFDTMVAHYLINADMKHGMDILAETYLNYKPISIETLIGKKGKNQGNMADVDPTQVVDYAAEDADITLQLRETFAPEVSEGNTQKLFDTMEVPLIKVLANMELEGINLDTDGLRAYSAELGRELEVLEKEIKDLAGMDFNVDSPRQLGEVLFDHLRISTKAKKTKTGQYQTSEDVLSRHADDHEIVPKILDYRQAKKLKSTYVDTLPGMVSPETGRVHTSFMQTVAATGRLASNNPNLQNIPIRTERGRLIRKAFIPRDTDHILMAADYSQVELRIIAALSNDPGMVEAFNNDEDVHAATAAKVFGVPLAEVDRDMRSKAKAVNFGIAYGQGAFGLAQNLNIKRGEAKEIIDSYYTQFPRLKEFQAEQVEYARQNGFVETIMGRRRYLKDINSSNAVVRGFAERNAVNAPIQGSAADVIKVAMVNIHELFEQEGFRSRMILQVHDELVFDAHKDELDTIRPLVVREMEQAVKLVVPLKVDVDTGHNWLEAH